MSDNPRKREPAETPDAESAKAEPAEAESKSLEEQVAQAKEDAQKYLASWQRAEADFRNYKRRVEQERDENRRFASAALIINILPILDDLERALGSLDVRLAGLTWFEGIALIHRKILILLENAGVTIIQAEGQQFDPREHEAVMHAEGEEGKVIEEWQKGYKLHDRVIRPAMVIVGEKADETSIETDDAVEQSP